MKLLPVDCERKTDEVSLCCSEEAHFHQEGHSPSQRSPEDYFLGGVLLVMEQKPIVSCHEEVLGTELSSSYLTLAAGGNLHSHWPQCWLGFGSAAVSQRGIW